MLSRIRQLDRGIAPASLAVVVLLAFGPVVGGASSPAVPGAREGDGTVATIDGEPVGLAELEEQVRRYEAANGERASAMTPEERLGLRRAMLERMINDRLIQKAASGLQIAPAELESRYRAYIERLGGEGRAREVLASEGQTPREVRALIEQAIRQHEWLDVQVRDRCAVGDDEVRRAYGERPELTTIPETVRASHVLVLVPAGSGEDVVARKRAQIEEIRKRAVAGEDFALLAKLYSEDPGSRDLGGDLNFFERDRMVPEFAEVAFELEPGALSEPVRTKYGFHLIKVTDRRAAARLSLEECMEDLRVRLQREKRETALRELVGGLRARAKVEVLLR